MVGCRAEPARPGPRVTEISDALRDDIAGLLAAAGVTGRLGEVSSCSSGGNNRIYRAEVGQSAFAVKHYFRHDLDPRNRLAAEYGFLQYAASAAPGRTPAAHACNTGRGIALYEFVDGRRFASGEIAWRHVQSAIAFFRELNDPRWRAKAESLPAAAEACFSIEQHLELVGARIHLLSEIAEGVTIERSARALIRVLTSFWAKSSTQIIESAARNRLDAAAPLDPAQRCISPSDFGFHNALAEDSGAIRFLDFEYAGWDDPAKTAGDFFAQVAVPVPQELFDPFIGEITQVFPRPHELVHRARLLRPVYRVKWCCIALNVFHPVHLARRKFADPALDETELKTAQLAKAEQLFQSISYGAIDC